MVDKPRSPFGRARAGVRKAVRRLQSSVTNAKEIATFGRLGDPWGSPYEIVHESQHYRLRRYANESGVRREAAGSLLLIPPLMVTSEVYDLAPDLSAVATLCSAGLDVWLVDFGAPEREAGGLARTLDDHVLAVDDAIARVLRTTGHPLHLVGYSQGGMFAYQAAAYRRCEGIASLVTFGSPVDIHRNLPAIDAELGGRMIGAARRAIAKPLAQLDALPGFLTSTGFKALSLRKELQQISEFLTKLHDRDALIKRESRRRFLAGEGFVAWPGPALRTFIDDFIVANRMSSGGFVIAGRTASLADIGVPILSFHGQRDDIARAAAVLAITDAAPLAEVHHVPLPAGHFGLVVGTTAMRMSWPTVAEWVLWRDCGEPRPRLLEPKTDARGYDEVEALETEPRPGGLRALGGARRTDEADFDPIFSVVGDVIGSVVDTAVGLVEQRSAEIGESFDNLRYQLPRLRTLEQLTADTRISLGLELSDRAARHPERTFFLWQGRAFSYAEADRRVDAIVRGLIDRGVTAGMRIGVLMAGRPTYLSLIAALNRLGAIAVLLKPGSPDAMTDAMLQIELAALICDPPNVDDALAAWSAKLASGPKPLVSEVLVLGDVRRDRTLPPGTFDMERIDPDLVELPDWYVPNPGRAADLALVFVTYPPASREAPAGGLRASTSPDLRFVTYPPAGGRARMANVSNGRWAVSAYGAAATCLLSSRDTVYCVLPLHHPAGMLVAVGGALVGRARLALAREFKPDSPASREDPLRGSPSGQPVLDLRFDPLEFWPEVRRCGATVLFYAGEMCRALVNAPRSPSESNHSLRMLAGSGMRRDLWQALVQRFGPLEIREFYASTEGNLVLANITGKPGALGRPLPGCDELAVVAYDFEAGAFVRDARGHARRCRVDEAGLLIAKLGPTHAGYATHDGSPSPDLRFVHDVFDKRDSWFVTGDIVRCDADGDYWYVDRTQQLLRGPHGWVASREIEDHLHALAELEYAVVVGLRPERVPARLRERVPVLVLRHRPEPEPSRGEASSSADVVVAILVVREPERFDVRRLSSCVAKLRPEQRPSFVCLRTSLALTDGFRPLKAPLVAAGLDPDEPHLLVWEPERLGYSSAKP
jgi:putative long chain acyl-CoA synthase